MKKILIIIGICVINSCVIDFGCAIFVLNRSGHTIYVYNALDKDSLSITDRELALMWKYNIGRKDSLTLYPSYRAEPDSMAGINFGGGCKGII
jgi:hypothetical protein